MTLDNTNPEITETAVTPYHHEYADGVPLERAIRDGDVREPDSMIGKDSLATA